MIKNIKINSIKFYYCNIKHISFYKVPKEQNYYETLGVPFNSDFEVIKKSYYKLAKKYHPDINQSKAAIDKFKEIKKAYEVLGDPNLRIAYDLENKFNEEDSISRRQSDSRYTSKYGKRVMSGPRTIKNFYYDKWSDYKTPKWSNTKQGMDSKAEYIIRDFEDEFSVSESTNKNLNFFIKYRIIFFLAILFSFDLYWLYKHRYLYNTYIMYKNTFLV